MDLPTVLAKVDARQYPGPEFFLADLARIVQVLLLTRIGVAGLTLHVARIAAVLPGCLPALAELVPTF